MTRVILPPHAPCLDVVMVPVKLRDSCSTGSARFLASDASKQSSHSKVKFIRLTLQGLSRRLKSPVLSVDRTEHFLEILIRISSDDFAKSVHDLMRDLLGHACAVRLVYRQFHVKGRHCHAFMFPCRVATLGRFVNLFSNIA